MKPLKYIALASLMVMASACASEKVEVLKSPCAGIDGSPCGPKRPVNGTLNPQLHQTNPADHV